MKEVQMRELQRALNLMTAMGCQYKIITPEGESFGDLVVEQPKKRKRNLDGKFGDMAAYYKPLVNLEMAVGDVIEIPVNGFRKEAMRAGICSYLIKHWGKGTYTTMYSNECIQVMRTAMQGPQGEQ